MALKRRKQNGILGKRFARSAERQSFKESIAALERRFGGSKFRGTKIQELLKVGVEARASSNAAEKSRLLKRERELRKQVEQGRK